MKSTFIILIALAISNFVIASPILENIPGLDGRLETITCNNGGYVTTKAQFDGPINLELQNECRSASDPQACFENLIKRMTQYSGVGFLGVAVSDDKQFDMTIYKKQTGRAIFNSLREGGHAWGTGISLFFARVGIPNDDYMINTGTLSEDFKSTSMIIVPVKKRFLADQMYFFFDCVLSWSR